MQLIEPGFHHAVNYFSVVNSNYAQDVCFLVEKARIRTKAKHVNHYPKLFGWDRSVAVISSIINFIGNLFLLSIITHVFRS